MTVWAHSSYESRWYDEAMLALRKHLRASPFLYSTILRCRWILAKGEWADPESQLVNSESHVVVEGYPSSGNSLLVNLIRLHHPKVRIASHTHAIANVRSALSLGVPVLVPFRSPEEAIASKVVRFGSSTRIAVAEYVAFYEDILELGASTHLVDFRTILSAPSSILSRTADLLNVGPSVSKDPLLNVEQQMQEWFAERGESHLGLPDREKEECKRFVRERLKEDRRWMAAKSVYSRLEHSNEFC